MSVQVVFVRSLVVGIFWKLVDNIYNPLHFLFINGCNAVIYAAYKVVPGAYVCADERFWKTLALEPRHAPKMQHILMMKACT